jgi:hypothetical protein
MITSSIARHDITLMGSLIGEGFGIENAEDRARDLSLSAFTGRLIRVMDESGLDVIAEFRNGEKLAA